MIYKESVGKIMIVLLYQDNSGKYITISGKNRESFNLKVAAEQNSIPQRVLNLVKDFSEGHESNDK